MIYDLNGWVKNAPLFPYVIEVCRVMIVDYVTFGGWDIKLPGFFLPLYS